MAASVETQSRESLEGAGDIKQDFSYPWVWVVAALALALHLACAGRYGFMRNELYFIVCGRHPAFGYADQPPLTPLIAAATQAFGESLSLLRLPAALAAAALPLATAATASLIGGGRGATLISAIAVAVPPGLNAISVTTSTPTFEPLTWTICAYLALLAAKRDRADVLIAAGLVAGVAFEAKYSIIVWLAGLLLGLVAVGRRDLAATRGFALGAALAVAIGAPSLIWQAMHSWPFLDIVAYHGAEGAIFNGSLAHFAMMEAKAMDIALAPLWFAGFVAPFLLAELKLARALAIASILTVAVVYATHGKEYYLFPIFPSLFAAGAVAAARLNRWALGAWLAVAVAFAALAAPLVLPILSPSGLRGYMVKGKIAIEPDEAAGLGAPITQMFADELGWRELEAEVARVYRALPQTERSRTAIFAANYGEAAAIDVFGVADSLPRASSGEDQYYLWGPPSDDTRDVIVVNGDPNQWRGRCGGVEEAGEFGAPLAMPYERQRPILICHDLRQPLSAIWRDLKYVHRKIDSATARDGESEGAAP
jgi:Dolichyl-phosphate-mannose-protein mannosyltransferase